MIEIINISSQVGSSICNNFGKYQYNFPFLLAIPFETYFISNINCRYTITSSPYHAGIGTIRLVLPELILDW
jgi:hypothetical protein